MIRTTACLCLLIFCICLYIERYDGATVFYEFHIRENTGNREENGESKDSSTSSKSKSRAEPEVIITGHHTSSVTLDGCVYKTDATYVVDDKGYHVQHNYSIGDLESDTRLSPKALKTTAG
ncbi:uncharacterized protein LOC117585647 [Drosophila guanche]|uniref:Uncharacterized protein n=1 Tax=Drosophila guanche TaxID=7266 RepID=A0A3B0K4T9_DROGU|nr:uncharacterized protein LOC117585647 [Drosophila guanche]SPP83010.1 Hypothetical predicted protein [Drosophila guanche]